tara:strand:- start:1432 stop:1860 length:429 start_codon:yes stop_codon:yes gene_type:complete
MSSNRLIYDEETYKTNLKQSVGSFAYTLDPVRYENLNKCRMELGVLAGTSVSHIRGNLVDLETELRGQNRNASACPSNHYIPPFLADDNSYVQPKTIKIKGEPNRQEKVIDTSLTHLPSCQMVQYKPIPKETKTTFNPCPNN